jgi:large subunit ribosomal protein L4
MPKAYVYDMTGAKISEMELPKSVFGIDPDSVAVHEAVKNHLANRRQGTQSALTRAEVRGGGRKPWRQKGTGRARQGSIRVPQFTHGGVAFAPKPRTYTYRLNKKYKRIALLSALSAKAAAGDIIVIENLDCAEIKTKTIARLLKAIDAENKAYIVTDELKKNVVLSARNIPGAVTTMACQLSIYDIVNSGKLIVDRNAVAKIEEVYGK